MKVAAIFLALALGGAAIPAKAPAPLATHEAAVILGFSDGTCSGTAVGPNLILTAEHCIVEGPLVKINGVPAHEVGDPVLDGNDHALVRVRRDGLQDPQGMFPKWAQLGGPMYQGQSVRFWGNPKGLTDIFRRGYVMGWEDGWFLIDALVNSGDSGAGIFDNSNRVVSVVSTLIGQGPYFHCMGAKPLAFTREQLQGVGL